MWGQGLTSAEKFKNIIATALSKHHKMTASIVVDRSRSGAQLLARPGATQKDDPREAFIDTFAGLFPDEKARRRFRSGEDESPAEKLFGEIPSAFPTIAWQVNTVSSDLGKKIEVVLLNGGANDIGFDSVISPREFPGDFIQRFEGEIQSIAYAETLQSIARVRSKCPKAIIMLFGYFAPFSYASHVSKIRAYFKYETDDDFGWAINKILKIQDVEAAIREARIRSVWAASRAQHAMRSAVTEANRNDAIRGPGVLFVPSAIDHGFAAFANTPKIAEEYKHPVSDPLQSEREKQCPRGGLLKDLQGVWSELSAGFATGPSNRFDTLHNDLKADGGPTSLIEVMTKFKSNAANTGTRAELLGRLQSEINRIQRTLIASFVHPNAKGAAGYADIAMRRYREHLQRVSQIKTTLPGRPRAAAILPGHPYDARLSRYGLRGSGSLLADIGHLDIDSIFVTSVTARVSEANLAPDISLVVETQKPGDAKQQHEFILNFPYYIRTVGSLSVLRKMEPDFEPATTTLSTIDTLDRLRLDEITTVYLRVGQDPLATQPPGSHGTIWRPRRILIEFNGVKVIDVTLQDPFVGPGNVVPLNYPPTGPVSDVLAPR